MKPNADMRTQKAENFLVKQNQSQVYGSLASNDTVIYTAGVAQPV
jgi:hypothetical protein